MFGALCRDDAYPSTFTFNIGKAADDLQNPSCCMAKNIANPLGAGRKSGIRNREIPLATWMEKVTIEPWDKKAMIFPFESSFLKN